MIIQVCYKIRNFKICFYLNTFNFLFNTLLALFNTLLALLVIINTLLALFLFNTLLALLALFASMLHGLLKVNLYVLHVITTETILLVIVSNMAMESLK